MVESTQAKSLADAKNPDEVAEQIDTNPEPADPQQTLQASSDDDKDVYSKKKHKIGKQTLDQLQTKIGSTNFQNPKKYEEDCRHHPVEDKVDLVLSWCKQMLQVQES